MYDNLPWSVCVDSTEWRMKEFQSMHWMRLFDELYMAISHFTLSFKKHVFGQVLKIYLAIVRLK